MTDWRCEWGREAASKGRVVKQVNTGGLFLWGNSGNHSGQMSWSCLNQDGRELGCLMHRSNRSFVEVCTLEHVNFQCSWPTVDELHGHLKTEKSLGKNVQMLAGGRFEGVWSGNLQHLLQLITIHILRTRKLRLREIK